MIVIRKHIIDTPCYRVGDQIVVGNYTTATCQKVTKKKALFCMDQYLDDASQMYADDNTPGGWEDSYLRSELLVSAKIWELFNDILGDMVPFKNGDMLRIPYAEELFGALAYVEPSKKKQWPLMKDYKNRIAFRNGDWEWGWLMNTIKGSSTSFAFVNTLGGHAPTNLTSTYRGVRLVFGLKNVNGSYYPGNFRERT